MLDIDRISKLYCSAEVPVQIYDVPLFDDAVRQYMLKLKELRNHVGEMSQNDYIRPYFRLFYAVQRCLTSTFLTADPIRFDYSPEDLKKLESQLSFLELMCSHRPQFEALLHAALGFQTKNNCMVETFKKYSGIALKSGTQCCYVPAPRLFKPQLIENEMHKDFSEIAFKSLSELRSGLPLYDFIFFAGPRCWYLDFSYLFDGSRAKQVYFIHYSWLARKLDHPRLSGLKKENSRPPNQQVTVIPQALAINEQEKKSEEILSEEDVFSCVKVEANAVDFYEVGEGATVPARQFDLSGGFSVFLEDKGSVRILDGSSYFWETPKTEVRRLRKGMYILLRCEGDGDYVRATAEQVFKEPYKNYMRHLIDWKRGLQAKIEIDSLNVVVSQLMQHGSGIANETNVQNWASLVTIKPKYIQDFLAIMTLLGRSEAESEKLWDEARRLINWHHQAGKKVAAELRSSIANFAGEKTEQLIKYGHVKVDLSIGASIDVFEVLGKSEEPEDKKYSQLNRPFSQES